MTFLPFTPLHEALTNTGYVCFWESPNEWAKRITPENQFKNPPENRFCFLPKPTPKFNGGQVNGLALYAMLKRNRRKEKANP